MSSLPASRSADSKGLDSTDSAGIWLRSRNGRPRSRRIEHEAVDVVSVQIRLVHRFDERDHLAELEQPRADRGDLAFEHDRQVPDGQLRDLPARTPSGCRSDRDHPDGGRPEANRRDAAARSEGNGAASRGQAAPAPTARIRTAGCGSRRTTGPTRAPPAIGSDRRSTAHRSCARGLRAPSAIRSIQATTSLDMGCESLTSVVTSSSSWR